MLKRRLAFLLIPALVISPVLSGPLVNVDNNGLALQGYDPVAYFTDSRPVKGDPAISRDYNGATYYFASQEHAEMFSADPGKYEPQFGGYCAYGVSVGGLYQIDVEAFSIFQGQLLLQKNKSIRDRFNKDPNGNYQKAVKNWPRLENKEP